jgi:hypothetical protein
MRPKPPVIDAEFEVISTGRPAPLGEMRGLPPPGYVAPPPARWTFWGDDLPNLAGIVAAVAVAIAIRAFFHHPATDLELGGRAGSPAQHAAEAHMTPKAYEEVLRAEFAR